VRSFSKQADRGECMRNDRRAWWPGALLLLLACGPAVADQRVGAGSVSSIANGRFDLACTNIVVGGTLNVNQATYVNVGDIHVLAGGTLNGGSGSITLSGTIVVDAGGQFNRQGITVQNDSTCAKSAQIATPVPALQDNNLIALGVLLAGLAGLRLRGRYAPERRMTNQGTRT